MIAGAVALVADIPPGWASIVLGVLGLAGTVAAILLAGSARTHSKAARTQVENNHDSNFREDMDEKDDRNHSLLVNVVNSQKGMKSDIRRILNTLERHSEQIWDLEQTQDPRRKPRG